MLDKTKLEQITEPNEQWKELIDETKTINKSFLVSSYGRIYSTINNRLVKLYLNKQTHYYYFYLDKSRTGFNTMNVHRAVALTFLEPPSDLEDDFWVVDHKNEAKADNRLCNLQYLKNSENVVRATALKRRISSYKKTIELRHKEAEIEKLKEEVKILKKRLSKYEDKAETALALNKESKTKKKLDYKQFIQ